MYKRPSRLTKLAIATTAFFLTGLLTAVLIPQIKANISASNQANTNPYLQARSHVEQILASGADKFLALSPADTAPAQSTDTGEEGRAARSIVASDRKLAELITIRAFLSGAIYATEGTYPNANHLDPYKIIFGYHTLDEYGKDFSDHPRVGIAIDGTNLTSDAAGVCQFMSDTWDGLHDKYPNAWFAGLPAFAPQNQDLGCALLFSGSGGYDILMKGVSVTPEGLIAIDKEQFRQAIATVCGLWASFPCEDGLGKYDTPEYGNQKAKPLDTIYQTFLEALEAEETRLFGSFAQADGYKAIAPDPTQAKTAAIPTQWLEVAKEGMAIAQYPITSPYGMRFHPVDNEWRMHWGADVGMDVGTKLFAPMPGTVSCTPQGRWATFAIFQPDQVSDRRFMIHHLASVPGSVCENGHYQVGEVFAKSGDAGTGPHAHFETQALINGEWFSYPPSVFWIWAFLDPHAIAQIKFNQFFNV